MNKVMVVIAYLVSVSIIFIGLVFSVTALYGGMLIVFIGMLFFPPLVSFLKSKTKLAFNLKPRLFLALVLFGVSSYHIGKDLDHIAVAGDFEENKEKVIGDINQAISSKSPDLIALVDRYQGVDDPDLNSLLRKARMVLPEIEAKKKHDQKVAEEKAKAAEEERSKERDFQVGMEYRAKEQVKSLLKDPSSAEFKNVYYIKTKDTPMICGQVNAKNSFGGYSGFKHFVSMGIANTTFIEDQVDDFSSLWNKFCVN